MLVRFPEISQVSETPAPPIVGLPEIADTTRSTVFGSRLLGWLLRYSARMKPYLVVILVAIALAFVAGWALRDATPEVSSQTVFQRQPIGVMGTVCTLALVTDQASGNAAQEKLDSAEAELRRLEALMSTWIDSSQLSRFNRAAAGETLLLEPDVAAVLSLARELHLATAGTFDITARPMIEIWRRAGQQGHLPSQEDLVAARAESQWLQIEISELEVTKRLSSTRVDVDGIAKGHAIDRALAILQESGATGGMVEIGGDLRLFGETAGAGPWTVAIRSPFQDVAWAEIEVRDRAVCSSGGYARFVEIEGRRYSHILDPRSGHPTQESHAVTVIGTDAATADAWATALSILGFEGLKLLEAAGDLEAMVVTGGPDDYEVRATTGFRRVLLRADFDLSN